MCGLGHMPTLTAQCMKRKCFQVLFHSYALECLAFSRHLVNEATRLIVDLRPALITRRKHL